MTSQTALSPELSLIVPTYNERENIESLVERVHRSLSDYDYELIVVDDNSPDGTSELAQRLSQKYPVRVIVRKDERGLASAVVAGFREARGKVLGVIDADLQHPPELIPSLLKEIREGADVTIGSRYVPGGGLEGWSMKREIISKVAKMMATLLLPQIRKIKDPLAGFFLFRKEVIEGVTLNPIGYKILLEVLIMGNAGRVTEVPYTFRNRERGKSNLNAREQISYLKHLYRLAKSKGWIVRFLKFCAVGVSGAGVNLGLLRLFVEVAGLQENLAVAISYQISILSNFALNEVWTFRDRRIPGRKSVFVRATKFILVSEVGWGINMAVFALMFNVAGIYYIVAEVIAIAVAMMWNFISNVAWTWRTEPGGINPLIILFKIKKFFRRFVGQGGGGTAAPKGGK
ncbi:glycosyltransferase [Chloroflexota bacterium]